MGWSPAWRAIAPPAEGDERFRQECERLSLTGLRILGAVEICVPILTLLTHWAVHAETSGESFLQTAALVAVGAATSLAAKLRTGRRHARAVAIASAFAAATTLVWTSSFLTRDFYGVDVIPAGVSLILLTTVAAVPLRPLQALGLGIGIEAAYAASTAAAHAGLADGASAASHHVFIVMLALLSTGVAAVLYHQRSSDWASHAEALRITEALTGAQLRAQLAENAASIGKLAAALTHEINTPLGALKSSVDTLLVVAARHATTPPEKQAALVATQAELRRSIQSSAERIQNVVARLQRFISLEEAEIKQANLNDLVSDVALLFQDQVKARQLRIDFDLEPLPAIGCRPQLLTAVFSSLLSNAINAVNGNGRIVVSTRLAEQMVEVRIQDNGRGMQPDEVDNIFDPSFRVAGDRVSSGNWSLFNIRQIVYEHGGDIQIESAPGKGTAVSVTIPR